MCCQSFPLKARSPSWESCCQGHVRRPEWGLTFLCVKSNYLKSERVCWPFQACDKGVRRRRKASIIWSENGPMCLAARPLLSFTALHNSAAQSLKLSFGLLLLLLSKKPLQCRWKPEVGSVAPLWTCAHVDNVNGVSVKCSINQRRLIKAPLRSVTTPSLIFISKHRCAELLVCLQLFATTPRVVQELCNHLNKGQLQRLGTLWHRVKVDLKQTSSQIWLASMIHFQRQNDRTTRGIPHSCKMVILTAWKCKWKPINFHEKKTSFGCGLNQY